MEVTFICTKDFFNGNVDNAVSKFDAYANYDLLNKFFGMHDKSLMCPKEEYFDGFDYSTWDDYVIMEDGKIVARAGIWKYSDEAWEVAGVSTLPQYRQQGYGEKVVRHCIAVILSNEKIATCTTQENNTAMIKTAQKAGFRIIEK